MRRAAPLLGLLLAAVAAALPTRGADEKAGELSVEFLDVGQGDAVLIRSPEGKVALVDAGPTKDLVKTLKRREVKEVDLAVLSHHHQDHLGGMAGVVSAYKPKVYLDSRSSHTTKSYNKLLEAVKDAGSKFIEPQRDTERRVNLGSVRLRVFPQPPEDTKEENNNSVGLRVEYGTFSVLLTGDSEAEERKWWLKNADPSLYSNVTVLKLAHHGSSNGTDAAWLRAAAPKLAVVSCGRENSYGHPHQRTLDLVKKAGVRLKRTDTDGTVVVRSDGKRWKVAEGD